MAINRKIISTPVIAVQRFLKKSRWDNFIGGLIFGAFFSLFVNLITIQVQETINQELYLEALENEIASHLIQTSVSVQQADDNLRKGNRPNYYNTELPFITRVWDSSDGLRYIVKLNPTVQANITTYYSYIIRANNTSLNKEEEFTNIRLKDCYVDFNKLTKPKQDECMREYQAHIFRNVSSYKQVHEHASKLLDVFHPTKNRLKDPILRLLIGSDSVEFLK